MTTFAPLKGIRVLDLSKVLAGPLCTQYLADMGAEVLKVEPCNGDDTRRWPPFDGGEGTVFLSANGNKRSIALDLKSDTGREICHALARQADIVVESFGPGVSARLGLDYDTLRALNPRLIYCGISGFGTVGPLRQGKGYDVVLQAFSGMISITGDPDRPPVRSPFSPVDQGTGLHALIGILGALIERGRTGQGLRVDASLFDTALGFLAYFLQGFWQRGTEPERVGSGHESLCPYQVFETADRPMILGVANDPLWVQFCKVAGEDALATRPEYLTNADRVAHRAACVADVASIMTRRTRDDWLSALGAAGVPCSPVHSFGEMTAHPHTQASGMIFHYQGADGRALNAVSQPLRFNGERPAARPRPPSLGEHTDAVLRELGYAEDAIAAMHRDGIVCSPGEPARD
ncbi:MAG: CoA transferase [Burkholderiaceae bacterium]|nr:CoA transferase [Burkholderiaceae bacterium]